jgi:hypothetical protein
MVNRNSKSKSKPKKQNKSQRQSIPQQNTIHRPTKGVGVRKAIQPASTDLVHAVCSNVNPFCNAAANAKVFDRSNVRSNSYRISYITSITNTGNGFGALQISPALYATSRMCLTSTTSKVSTWSAYSSVAGYADIAANFDYWRPVTFGVRVFGMTNADQSAGLVHMVDSDQVIATPDYTDIYEKAVREPLATADIHWISSSKGDSNPFNGIGTGATASWTECTIMVSQAAASTGCVAVEVFMNVELIPKYNAVLTHMTTPSNKTSSHIEDAITNARSSMYGIYQGSTAMVTRYLEEHVKNILRSAAPAAQYALGAAFPQLGMAMRTLRIGN